MPNTNTSTAPAALQPAVDFLTRIKNDAEHLVAVVEADFTYLAHEFSTVMAWVEKEMPEAKPAIAAFFQEAEQAAASLASHSQAGLQGVVASSIDGAQTTLLNIIQSSHLSDGAKGDLKLMDITAATLAKNIAQQSISVGGAQLLAKLLSLAA